MMIENIIVLSLKDAEARRTPLVEQLKELRLDFTLWDAVDGRFGLSDADEKRIDRVGAQERMGRPMSDTEFACALSHHDIYQDILQHGRAHTLILEDDAILTARFADLLKTFAMEDYDLVLLDHWRTRVHRRDRQQVSHQLHGHRVAGETWLTTGYVVSLKGAGILAASSSPVRSTADWPCALSQLRAYAVVPRVVDHPDVKAGPSDIRPQRQRLKDATPSQKRRGPRRFLDTAYWKKFYYKRFWKWVS